MGQWAVPAIVCVVTMSFCLPVLAQDDAGVAPSDSGGRQISLWSTIKDGGVIGFLIILMSLVSVALIVEHFISIRRDRLIPPTLVDTLHEQLEVKAYQNAQEACAVDGSFLSLVIGSGLNQIGAMFGFFDMQNAMQEVSERQISKLYRKLDYLSFIAATSPMLGLLGTVTGMIRSFNQIALTEGTARPSQLAGGISEALVTTCLGLVVAIPTMFFVSFFRNRIDSYVAEAETVVEKLMGRFRKQ
jgi:biopolymer transport protein ExbB